MGRYSLVLFLIMQRLIRVASSSGSGFQRANRRNVAAFATKAPQRRSYPVNPISPISSPRSFPISLSSTTRLFSSSESSSVDAISDFYASSDVSFESIGVKSPVLLERLDKLGLTRPSAVQASAYSAIEEGTDAMVGAETGSGKTLAYLLPLIDEILQKKAESDNVVDYDYCRAIILVPNKELVNQVVRMATDLCGGPECRVDGKQQQEEVKGDPSTMVRLAVMPGAMKEPEDFQPFRNSIALGGNDPPVDIVISTPAAVGPLGLSPKNIDMFADVKTLIVDEADMLLDGGYIRPLNDVLLGFRRAGKIDATYGVTKTQYVFVAATLPDMGLRSVDAFLQKRFPYAKRVTMAGMHNARHYGLRDQTIWIEEEGNKERMERLVELLKTSPEDGGLQGEKVMVFLNSVDDVDGATGALDRAGFSAVKYHAKIKLAERTDNLDRFRKYSPDGSDEDEDAAAILVCTDLASRGLDIPGVSAVVQLQFAGNVVAHLHRMGRCGRAGQRNGRGIIFYDSKQRELIEVVRDAEEQQERMVLEGDVDDPEEKNSATVTKAFSRKRGFTKKRKKERKLEN